MNKSIVLLFLAKIFRMFSYGALSVIFIKSLLHKNIKEGDIGLLQSLIAFGDIGISLYLTTRADQLGRRKTLIVGAFLKMMTGIFYAFSNNFLILAISGILGVISVSGGQIGPFVPIEQAAVAQIVENQNLSSKSQVQEKVAKYYGYYNMFSYLSQAFGAFFAGTYIQYAPQYFQGKSQDYFFHIMLMYSIFGSFKMTCYCFLEGQVEPNYEKRQAKKILNCVGLTKQSSKIIVMLSALFILDTFGGGFVAQTFLSFYFDKQYQFSYKSLGLILFGCNIIGGISGVVSSKLVKKIGAMATMIYTHLPSNILLILIAFTSNAYVALLLILGRFCISQMDVPARQTYVSMVVSPEERSAANGITNIARSVGVSMAFPIVSLFFSAEPKTFWFSFPFLLGGTLKVIYDVTLGLCFLRNKQKQKKEKKKDFKQVEVVEEQFEKQKTEEEMR